MQRIIDGGAPCERCSTGSRTQPRTMPSSMRTRFAGCRRFPGPSRSATSDASSTTPQCQARIQGIPVSEVELPAIQLERPLYYVANRLAVTGHEADVKWPAYSTVRDYELEFACILGRGGADIPVSMLTTTSSATPSSRLQCPGHPTRGDLDRSRAQQEQGLRQLKCAGPVDRHHRRARRSISASDGRPINGEEVSRGTSAEMHHTFADMITFASSSTQLYAGEVLCSGTVPTGCGLEHGRYLEPADVVELEVSGIGILRNRVMA